MITEIRSSVRKFIRPRGKWETSVSKDAEREATRAVLTAVDVKIETRFLIGIWKPTPISGVMLALTCYKSLLG
ncbi:MAG: hypothetical protein AN490_02835 [Anabaena sp. AL09]|jgi:hypothetical protein|nr:MAG: hypothetical protein AN490_02835 [Anabaena sp. AL09]